MSQLWRAKSLAEAEFEDPPFLVDKIIPQGGLVLLYSKPNLGKTQLALTLASHITSGQPFLSRYPVEQGPVVFIEADMTPQIMQIRVQKASSAVSLGSTYFFLPDTVEIRSFKIRFPSALKEIRELSPVLVVWDTLRKITRLSENASETPSIVYEAAKSLVPGATHLFLHHELKDSADPKIRMTAEQSFRGSSAWWGDSDTTIQLDRVRRNLKLKVHKARTTSEEEKERASVWLTLDPQTMLLLPRL